MMQPLDPDKIEKGIHPGKVGHKVIVFSQTSSTSDIACEYARNPKNDRMAIFAETQTKGRGRLGRKWQDTPGKNLLCSVILNKTSLSAEALSLTVPLAVAHTIGDAGPNKTRIKWPNDIYIAARKIAGILIETRSFEKHQTLILGIGINCHQKKFPPEIRKTSTSLDLQNGTTCDRNTVARRLMFNIEHWITKAEKNLNSVKKNWIRLNDQLHQRITVNSNGTSYTGNCEDIKPDEGLVLRLDNGTLAVFNALQTSIEKT